MKRSKSRGLSNHCKLMQSDHFIPLCVRVGQDPVRISGGSYKIKIVAMKKLVSYNIRYSGSP